MNFDKYGCLIQYPSDTGKKKKSIHVKAYENRLTHLSLDIHFEVYGLCFNLLKIILFKPTNFHSAGGLDFLLNTHFI